MGGSASRGTSDSESRTFIDPSQLRFLRQLWGAGSQLMGQQGGIWDAAQQAQGGVMPWGMQGLEAMGGMAGGQGAGMQALAQNMNSQSPWLQSQIGALGEDISQNLQQNILPSIQTGGISAGAGPNAGRANIAAGMAANEAQRQFANQATNLRAQDLLRQQQAAQAYNASALAGAQGAIGGAQGMYNLGMSPWQSAWLPLQMMGGLLGTPAILSRSESEADETSVGFST